MKVITYTELSDTLYQDWKSLWDASQQANYFSSPMWLAAAEKAFHYKKMRIVAVYDETGQRLLAIAPFVNSQLFGLEVFVAPAQDFVGKSTMLYDSANKQSLVLLFKQLSKIGVCFLAQYAKEEILLLKKYLPFLKIMEGDPNPYIDLAKGKYGQLSNSNRNNLLNRVKRGADHILCVARTHDPQASLAIAFRIDMQSDKHAKGKGIFYCPEVRNFYQELAKLSPEMFIVSLLYINALPVAYSIGFFCNGVFRGNRKAHLPGCEYYRPGKLLLLNLIDYFYEKQMCREIDLGSGNDQFKQDFTKDVRLYKNVLIVKNSLVRCYIMCMFGVRNTVYRGISAHTALFRLYKRLKGYNFTAVNRANLKYC